MGNKFRLNEVDSFEKYYHRETYEYLYVWKRSNNTLTGHFVGMNVCAIKNNPFLQWVLPFTSY